MVARNVVVGMGESLPMKLLKLYNQELLSNNKIIKTILEKLSKVLGSVGIGSDLVLSSVGAGFTNGSIVY